MPLHHKGYTWNLETYHKWQDRLAVPKAPTPRLLSKDKVVFGMGSCFADNVVRFLSKEIGVSAASFTESRLYDPVSVLQTLRHLLVEPQYGASDLWRTADGLWANPFRNPRYRAKTVEELQDWTSVVEADAAKKLKAADLVVITLGGTETWRHPTTKKTYVTIPFPDVFNSQMPGIAEFHNLPFAEVYEALEQIYLLLRKARPDTHLLFTVSPVRMTFTTTDKDVAVATSYSKSVLRAAVGELTDKYKDHLHYFQSYEIASYCPPGLQFFGEDDIHVTDLAVKIIMNQFGRQFLTEDLQSKSGLALLETMMRDGASAQALATIDRVDFKYVAIKILRTLGLEQTALMLYRRLRTS